MNAGLLLESALASIPSPPQGVWHLGPVPIRAYALAILAGIFAGVWLGRRRWVARGGNPDLVGEVAMWAVPAGIIGGRLYHVFSSPDAYFGPNGDPLLALQIWRGGLGIWGAVALGALGAWWGCRRHGVRFLPYMDCMAPGILLAQAIGRLGNWFNQELFGSPTDLPWGLVIDRAHRPTGMESITTYHPTFLYELLWNLGGVLVLLWLDRKFRFGHGRMFWAYVVLYTCGRVWIEMLRIDDAEHILGLRLNVWTSIFLCILGIVFFIRSARRHPGQETDLTVVTKETNGPGPDLGQKSEDLPETVTPVSGTQASRRGSQQQAP